MAEKPTIYAETTIPSFLTARPWGDAMKDDLIVAEVREIREEILASYGGDVHKMLKHMMKRQWESGRRVVKLSGGKIVDAAKPQVTETDVEYGTKDQA